MPNPILRAVFLLALAPAALSAQTLVVVNQGDSTVSLIDPGTSKTIAVVPENTPGVHVHEAAVSPDGRTAYLPVYGSSGVGKPGIDGHQMLFLDVRTHRITDTLDFGHGVRPHLPVVDSTSGLVYVTTELDRTITIVDPHTHKIIGTVPTGQEQSHMLTISRDGRRGYTANVGPGTVSVLDLVNRKTVAVLPVSKNVQRIALSADDKLVFTADQTQPQLDVIDTRALAVRQRVALPAVAYGTAATPDGRWLLITLPSLNQVAVLDLKSMQITRTLSTGASPQEVLIRPDGKVAYVSCMGAGKVAAIDLALWVVEPLISAGPAADGLAWAR
jgi:DNA-binding beta-propeller fold protein YncE